MYGVLLFVLLLLPGVSLDRTPTAVQILARSKVASGAAAWDSIHSLRTVATVKLSGGVWGTETTLADFHLGRFVSRLKVGSRTVIASGFDGKSGWTIAFDGPASIDRSPTERQASVTRAYIATYAWWYPRRAPAQVNGIGQRVSGAERYWVVRITPEQGSPFDLWIDAKSWLVSRIVEGSGAQETTVYLGEYRTTHGVKVAFHRREVSTLHGGLVTEIHVQAVAMNVPASAIDFATPRQR